jgi:GntR family transcriptional regulator
LHETVPPALRAIEKFWPASMQGMPKYVQLRVALTETITSGCWQPGAKLPTETELARHTPFSLGTVQRALRVLADEGLIVRQQGSGTYVAPARKPMDEPWHCRFIADDGHSFVPVYPRAVGRKRIREQGAWSAHLGGIEHIRIDRVIAIGGEFSVYSRFYLDAERFAGILDKPLAELDGQNLKALIGREFGLPVTRVSQTFASVRFSDAICRALELRRGLEGNLLEIAASAGRDRPVYMQELFIPRNPRRLVVSDSYETKAI